MLPMAFTLEEGSEFYAPLARAIIGGLIVSVILTLFIVPAAYLLVHRKHANVETKKAEGEYAYEKGD
jgi:hydrophobic/amphiphilic exporter-1 (mainly G- bacteria), HAE1 family